MTSATSGAQPSTVTTPSASSVTSLSGRYGENTRSAQCSHKMASSSDPSSRAVAGTSKETTVPITGSACRTRARSVLTARAGSLLNGQVLLKEDAAAAHLDVLGGQRHGGRPGDDGAGRDVVLAAVARAVDGAVADLADDAAHVGADRAERLELIGRGLGDDHLGTREDRSAAHRNVAGGRERGRPGARRLPRGAGPLARRSACRAPRLRRTARTARTAGGDHPREARQADAGQHATPGGQRVRLWFLCH